MTTTKARRRRRGGIIMEMVFGSELVGMVPIEGSLLGHVETEHFNVC